MSEIIIPINGTRDYIFVPLDELPDVPDVCIDVLFTEKAPLSVWMDVAKGYFARDK